MKSQHLLQFFGIKTIHFGFANHDHWNSPTAKALELFERTLVTFDIKFHETHFMLLQKCLGLSAIWTLAGTIKSDFGLLFHRAVQGIGLWILIHNPIPFKLGLDYVVNRRSASAYFSAVF